MTSISIIHIEDEYHEFDGLVVGIQAMIEEYYYDQGRDVIVDVDVVAECEAIPPMWQAYKIHSNQKDSLFVIHYVFVKSSEVPVDVEVYMSDRNLFVLDMLRPNSDGTILEVSVDKSIKSILKFSPSQEDVVLFTAHQGETPIMNFGNNEPINITKISKNNEVALEEFYHSAIKSIL